MLDWKWRCKDAYHGQIDPSSVHSAAPAGAWWNLVAQHTDRGIGKEDELLPSFHCTHTSSCSFSWFCLLFEQTAGHPVIWGPGLWDLPCRLCPTCTTPPLPLYRWSHRTSTGTQDSQIRPLQGPQPRSRRRWWQRKSCPSGRRLCRPLPAPSRWTRGRHWSSGNRKRAERKCCPGTALLLGRQQRVRVITTI